MNLNNQIRGGKVIASSNVYTIILALAFCVVLATAAFVAYKLYLQYGTIIKIP
jgi:hypothetical protein